MNDELTNVICLEKTRDLTNNGQITNLKISSLPKTVKDTILVVDDLCDGGRTFVETALLLRMTCPNRKLLINVTHAVNESGLLKLTEYYNGIYITNSYKDWQKGHNFKNKVKIYNILDDSIMSI
jgi:ribose-phosphate pyrophosphokinase